MSFSRRGHTIRSNSEAVFLQSGDSYFDFLLKAIQGAQHHIHFQFYILSDDHTGMQIMQALRAAAGRGVRVMIIADGYASPMPDSKTLQAMRKEGIRYKRFSPVSFLRFKTGRRLHHKICIIDGHTGIIGGINIADKYHGDRNHPAWLDFAVVLKGHVIGDLERICFQLWKKRTVKTLLREYLAMHHAPVNDEMKVRILQNDWIRRRIEISSAYKNTIRHAEKELIVVASYFLPGNSIRRLLKKAASRKVRIKLVVGKFSDVMIFKPASMFLYHWLLRHNIEIYEWQKSVMHGKMMIADGKKVNIGSYNLNAISDYASIELNAEIHDEAFSMKVRDELLQLIEEGCHQVQYHEFNARSNFALNAYRWICYQLIRGSLRLLFLMIRDKQSRF